VKAEQRGLWDEPETPTPTQDALCVVVVAQDAPSDEIAPSLPAPTEARMAETDRRSSVAAWEATIELFFTRGR
jgi:hypothetical protein